MKTAIACGGTGGHIFPGLATAAVLRERGHDVTLWVAGKDIESAALTNWQGDIHTVAAEGLPHGFSLRAIRTAWKLLRAAFECRRMMKQNRPDVLLAMGSYASAGPVAAALMLGVPVVLHEANVLPGRAIAFFAPLASAVAASFEESRYYLKRKDIVITGMPLRRELEGAARRIDPAAVRHDQFTILVMGGSRGAHRLNDVASAALVRLHKHGHALRVIHLTGVADEDAIRKVYEQSGVPHEVHAFISDMAPLFAAADLAVCRSGAATCTELNAFAVPALLVPYPYAANDHQTVNARALERIGAADMVPEQDLGEDWLVDYIVGGMRAPDRLARMSAAGRSRVQSSAAESLANLVIQTGGSRRGAGA